MIDNYKARLEQELIERGYGAGDMHLYRSPREYSDVTPVKNLEKPHETE